MGSEIENIVLYTVLHVINFSERIWIIWCSQTRYQLAEFTLGDMPFKTKLTSPVYTKGLTDCASLKIIRITTVTLGAITDLNVFGRCMYYDLVFSWWLHAVHRSGGNGELLCVRYACSKWLSIPNLKWTHWNSHLITWDQCQMNHDIHSMVPGAGEFKFTLDDVIKWKHLPHYWPFVRGIHRSPVNYPHKGQWRRALMFYLICARINGWVKSDEADDLRRHRAHYDVIVMKWRTVCVMLKFSLTVSITWTPQSLTVGLQRPVSLRLMTSQFKDFVTLKHKYKIVKCIFCVVWVQNFVWNFKGIFLNFIQNFDPIHCEMCILRGGKKLTIYDILELWHLDS